MSYFLSDPLQLLSGGGAGVLNHLIKVSVGFLQQLVRMVKLLRQNAHNGHKKCKLGILRKREKFTHHHCAAVHHQNAVGVHDGVEAVGYSQNCTELEFLTNSLLNQSISPENPKSMI